MARGLRYRRKMRAKKITRRVLLLTHDQQIPQLYKPVGHYDKNHKIYTGHKCDLCDNTHTRNAKRGRKVFVEFPRYDRYALKISDQQTVIPEGMLMHEYPSFWDLELYTDSWYDYEELLYDQSYWTEPVDDDDDYDYTEAWNDYDFDCMMDDHELWRQHNSQAPNPFILADFEELAKVHEPWWLSPQWYGDLDS